jgi:phosphoenolpyruvate carboxykinase (GTP)
MELRVNGETDAIETPCGYIPKYDDLVKLFKEVLGDDYTKEQYEEQFTMRIPERLAKKVRIMDIYHTKVFDTPHVFLKAMEDQKKRLEECQKKHGDYISPFVFEKEAVSK